MKATRNKQAQRWLQFGLTCLWALWLGLGSAQPVLADPEAPADDPFRLYLPLSRRGPAAALTSGPMCRFGLNVVGSTADFDAAPLRIGWYIDYSANVNAPRPGGAAYSPVVGLAQVGTTGYTSWPAIPAELDAVIAGNPGAAWMIGNEPDRRLWQSNMLPAGYAHAYHDLYTAIKAKDPTARIFAGTIVQPTPLRLKYLDAILEAYRAAYGESMPVDGWAMHNFILNERSCDYYSDPGHKPADYDGPPNGPYDPLYVCWGADIPPGIDAIDGLVIHHSEIPTKMGDIEFFKQQVVNFRQWMYDRGYSDSPLYLSEFGILLPEHWGFPPETVNKFMTESFNYLLTQRDAKLGYAADDYRLVQRFAWYSTLDVTSNGNLFESITQNPRLPPFQFSSIGNNYLNFTAPIEVAPQIVLRDLNLTPRLPLISSGPVTFTLTATVANAGNNETPAQTTIRFYDGDPATGGVQIGVDQVVNVSGCGAIGTAQVEWPNVGASKTGRPVFAKLIADGVEQTIQESVFFAAERLALPSIRRAP